MEFERPIMRKSALMQMGFSEQILDTAYRDRNQRFAWKINPTKQNSPIEFDTKGFGAWLEHHMTVDRMSRH